MQFCYPPGKKQSPSRWHTPHHAPVNWWRWFTNRRRSKETPQHIKHGRIGEKAARKFLRQLGFTCLVRNYRSRHGEIDLICRDGDCLVFVEVKTRSTGGWTTPEQAVDRPKRRRLSLSALEYLRSIRHPPIQARFDIVEVLLRDGTIHDIQHLADAFPLEEPFLAP